MAVLGRRIGGEFSDFAELYDLEPEESVLSADLDYDGQNTFAEWTLGGTDPNDPSSTPSLVMEVRSIDGGQYLTLCFLRLAGGTEAGTATRWPTWFMNARERGVLADGILNPY